MRERCALKGGEYREDGEAQPIPKICMDQCRDIWRGVMLTRGEIVDSGADPIECDAEPEWSGEGLCRTRDDRFGDERTVFSASECVIHEVERNREVWQFHCPNN